MNKKGTKIVIHAIEMLKENAEITSKWEATPLNETDGKVTFAMDGELFLFNAIVGDTIRNVQIPAILANNQTSGPIIVVARSLFPKIKHTLRQEGVAYLEANGNVFLKRNGVTLWLDGQKSCPSKNEEGNRAFTKTGLKVLFNFLVDQDLLNLRYREIAKISNVALGNINYVITGLKQLHFITSVDDKRLVLNNKKDLLQKWITAYEERLKPTLLIGTFRFLRKEDFSHWKNIELNIEKTAWGGEPAGDLLTDYLHPGGLTMYTTDTKAELIKNYKLIPDDNGNIKIYQRFWENAKEANIVPPLLVYADLINAGDRRSYETAQKIYNDSLQNQFESNQMGQ